MASRVEIQHRVDVMQAWLDGEVIELMLKGSSRWSTFDDEMNIFGWEYGHEYRIKLTPREVYMLRYSDGTFDFTTVQGFFSLPTDKFLNGVIKFREVLEE